MGPTSDEDSDQEDLDLSSLVAVRTDSLNRLSGDIPEWEEVEFMVDSGAGSTVIPPDGVKAVEPSEPNPDTTYRLADGSLIPDKGIKTFNAQTEDEGWRTINANVTDVDKPLLSVSQIVQASGATVVFSPEGNYIQSPKGSTLPMELRNNTYFLKMWVPRDQGMPFHGRT